MHLSQQLGLSSAVAGLLAPPGPRSHPAPRAAPPAPLLWAPVMALAMLQGPGSPRRPRHPLQVLRQPGEEGQHSHGHPVHPFGLAHHSASPLQHTLSQRWMALLATVSRLVGQVVAPRLPKLLRGKQGQLSPRELLQHMGLGPGHLLNVAPGPVLHAGPPQATVHPLGTEQLGGVHAPLLHHSLAIAIPKGWACGNLSRCQDATVLSSLAGLRDASPHRPHHCHPGVAGIAWRARPDNAPSCPAQRLDGPIVCTPIPKERALRPPRQL
eukprot:11228354-Lingulodinium_polyedra.AAC.2